MTQYPRRPGGRTIGVLLLTTLLAASPPALALNPALDISQYAHTAWSVREGFTKGTINALAQTPDGYLWLGTVFGLLRFDGVRTVLWQSASSKSLPSDDVETLLVAHDGALWIGTDKGLVRWTGTALSEYPELKGRDVIRLLEGHDETIWASTLEVGRAKLCAIRHEAVDCQGEDGRFGDGIWALHEDRDRNLWASVSNGLWRLGSDRPQFFAMPGENGLQSFADLDGGLVIGTATGLRRLRGGTLGAGLAPAELGPFHTSRLLRDRDGGLWIGTHDRGLFHLHNGRVDSFSHADGLSNDNVWSILEDREGVIWVATSDGLDRFHDVAVARVGVKEGLSHATVSSVLATRDGTVWMTTGRGLNRWSHGLIATAPVRAGNSQLSSLTSSALFEDQSGRLWFSNGNAVGYLDRDRFVSFDVSGPARGFTQTSTGALWAATQRGLVQFTANGIAREIQWAAIGHHDFATALTADARGGLWVGFWEGGLAYFKDEHVMASYSATDGLGDGRVNDVRVDHEGTVWAATAGGLSRLQNGGVKTLTSRNGLPCDSVQWAIPDDAQSWWLYLPCGLAQVPTAELNAWALAADDSQRPHHVNNITVFDPSDGVPLQAYPLSLSPAVAKAEDGTLWFTSFVGLAVVDPRRVPFNTVPPPVHIEQITADRRAYDMLSRPTEEFRLPPLTRDVEIHYTALSLIAPEKVRFRYRLEGRDASWQESSTRRQALYSDLRPGHYRFRVVASNNDGVWNDQGAAIEFNVEPAWFQTATFRVLAIGLAVGFIWALYLVRVRQIARALNARFDERLAERTRVARELHDTLVQTVQGSKLVADHALKNAHDHSALVRAMEQITEWLARANDEGRAALNALRTSVTQTNDLADALRRALDECRTESRIETSFSAIGTARELHPVVRDEIYRIAYEAIRNACKHSHGEHVEVILEYARDLRLCVADDGIGIPEGTLTAGKDGHFGLRGMRERASRINARLSVDGRPPSGTAVNLVVPGRIAFSLH